MVATGQGQVKFRTFAGTANAPLTWSPAIPAAGAGTKALASGHGRPDVPAAGTEEAAPAGR